MDWKNGRYSKLCLPHMVLKQFRFQENEAVFYCQCAVTDGVLNLRLTLQMYFAALRV